MTVHLPILAKGDTVEIVAPASRCADSIIRDIKDALSSWGLKCIIAEDIFGDDLLCANEDSKRLQTLTNALFNRETKGIICARGGYGSMRLIPGLLHLKPPLTPKFFLGMSDITALNFFLQQNWGWPIVHGALARDKFSPESIQALKSILFGEVRKVTFAATPLNEPAKNTQDIKAPIIGGNLCIVQTSIGTPWQINLKNKMLFLEDINERGFKIDRMLQHLAQAGIFKEAQAIIFGDFIQGKEPDGSSLIEPVLHRFAKSCPIPVVAIQGVGHDYTSLPLPLGTNALLKLFFSQQPLLEVSL